MNFKFKLSKRLAILKAALATSVVLALACERDLTDPKLSHSIPRQLAVSAALTPVPVVSVVASANHGNLPQNTLDNSLATRWSAQGDGQWIRYDLGAIVDMDRVAVAWYLGDSRIAYFDIEVSWDAGFWWRVFSGQSSGQTLQPEIYAFPRTSARYVRIVGHGSSQSAWNSITEVAIVAPATTITSSNVPVAAVTVSPASTSVAVGATVQLAAVTRDSAGNTLTGRTVTWTISNSAVATIAASGLVTGVATGTVTITATSEGQSGTAAVSATAPACLTSAGTWRNNAIPSRAGGFEAQFDATPTMANMNGVVGLANGPAADWTNLAAIVRFNSTGTIDARDGGDYAAATAIPYTAGTTYHFRLDVDLASHSYTTYVTPAGGTEQPVGNAFAFRTEQSAVSALNTLGGYAAAGGATVCNVTLGAWTPPAAAPVASVTVSPAAPSVSVGATAQLTATPKDSGGTALTGRTVTWASSNTSTATVSSSGLVKGVAAGAATVTLVPVATVVVSPAPAMLPLHGTLQLNVTLKDASGNPLTGRPVAWTSSTPTVMTVSPTGLVTDVADGGTATVTATSEGKSGTSAVTVQAPLPAGSVADPTLLPVASGQVPNMAAYTALNVARQAACFSFSSVVGQERIAYVINGNQVKRFNTATMQVENTGFFPLTGTFQRWLHQDKNDIWFTGLQDNSTAFAWNSQTNELRTHSETWLNEPRLERDGRYIALTTSNSTIRLWDLVTNTFGPTQTDVLNIWLGHNANLRGMWVTTDVNASAPFDLDRYYPSGGQIVKTRFLNNSAGAGVHHAGNWVQSDAELGGNLNRQWSFVGGVDNNAFTATALWKQAIGVMRADGSDARFLVHHYSTNATYSDDPFVKPSPDGKVVMFDSNMAGSGRYDVFVAEVPLR